MLDLDLTETDVFEWFSSLPQVDLKKLLNLLILVRIQIKRRLNVNL